MPPVPLIIALALGAAAATIALVLTWRGLRSLPGGQRWTLVALRGLALATVLAAVADPVITTAVRRTRAPELAV
ncbi:MAG TPA: hypothetical protein VM283_09830, partial [Armatimonadota bacterium]|nr:hypothetical protein [Armatimonadota bacterium]